MILSMPHWRRGSLTPIFAARCFSARSKDFKNTGMRDGKVLLDAAPHPFELLTVSRELNRQLILHDLFKRSPLSYREPGKVLPLLGLIVGTKNKWGAKWGDHTIDRTLAGRSVNLDLAIFRTLEDSRAQPSAFIHVVNERIQLKTESSQ